MEQPPNYVVTLLATLEERGRRDAVVAGSRRISGAEAHDMVLRFAAALRDLGVRDGAGVALFVENSPEAALLPLAVHFAGGRVIFVPPEPGPGELRALLRDSDAEVLLFDPVHEDRTRRIVADIGVAHIRSLGPSSSAPDFLTAADAVTGLGPHEVADARHIATLLYTGGTTGSPLLVVHRHRYYDLTLLAGPAFEDREAVRPVTLICTLVTHSSGHIGFLLALLTGQVAVLLRSFDAGTALAVMESERVTTVNLVTPMLYEILDHPSRFTRRTDEVRRITYMGASAAPARLQQAMEHFGPVLLQAYGATEFGIATLLWPEEHNPAKPESLTSCGRPGQGVEIDLRDENGKPVAVGEVGELYVRSPFVTEGYWNAPERTAEVLDDDGWFRSGDLARRDEHGYLYVVDRARDVIVTGRTADNVYSRLLDDFLLSYPGVREATTVGLPGPDLRETVHVALVPQEPARVPDLVQLTRAVVEELGELYAPASYSIALSLPRTAVGKINKKLVRAALLAENKGPAGI